MTKRFLHISIVLLAIAFSCDYKKGLLPRAAVPLAADACDSIKYNNSMKAIFDAECKSCHGGVFVSGGVDLSTYPNVLAKVVDGRIADRINNINNFMPPSGLMSQARRDSIMCWINKGGPQ